MSPAWTLALFEPLTSLQRPSSQMGKLNLRRRSVLSHCLLNPGIGKARTGKLEEDARSRRNCGHVYFFLAGTAARQQQQTCCIFSWSTEWTQPHRTQHATRATCLQELFRWCSYRRHICAVVYANDLRAWPLPSWPIAVSLQVPCVPSTLITTYWREGSFVLFTAVSPKPRATPGM